MAKSDDPVERCLQEFDFDKAANALRGCGWKFNDAAESPSTEQLQEIARRLCTQAYVDHEVQQIAQGPFEVEIKNNSPEVDGAVRTMILRICPVRSHAVYVIDEILIRGGHWISPSIE